MSVCPIEWSNVSQNRHPVGLTPLESTGNELIAIPMKRYILRAFTRLALVWTLRRPATMLFRSFLTLRNSQSRQIEQYLSNLRRVLRGRSAMGKSRKLLCNKTLMVKGVGFENVILYGEYKLNKDLVK
jgi:hypothetical protein